MRKHVLLLALLVAPAVMTARPAAAQIYPWCAIYATLGGAQNCGFTSREQCEVNIRGTGGTCQPNPQWIPPSERPRRGEPRPR